MINPDTAIIHIFVFYNDTATVHYIPTWFSGFVSVKNPFCMTIYDTGKLAE